MTRRVQGQGRFSNRQKTWAWILVVSAVVFGLLYWEQIALLYVLATVSVTVLLLVVGLSDLGASQTPVATLASADKATLVDDAGLVAPISTTSTFGSRPKKRRS